jgi:hypothetical protein
MRLFPSKSRPRAEVRSRRLLSGLGGGAAFAAVAYYRNRLLARRRQKASAPAAAVPDTTPEVPEAAFTDRDSGGKSLDSLVPASYSIPDPDAALGQDGAIDASAEKPPVQSVFSEPGSIAQGPQ